MSGNDLYDNTATFSYEATQVDGGSGGPGTEDMSLVVGANAIREFASERIQRRGGGRRCPSR